MPEMSVIIPCYNQGRYLNDAVSSVLAQTYQDFEIVIVNDGSTDKFTNKLLANLQCPKIRVLYYKNGGVSAARNNGIKLSRGKYILPLDADDRIGPSYLGKAVDILDNDDSIGIVYCDAKYFGMKRSKMPLPEFSMSKMLLENVIFCSGMFRKKDWERSGGYCEDMKLGYEDWDFWLSILELGVKVYKIPEVLFYYRIKKLSRNKSIMENESSKFKICLQIIDNHNKLYSQNMNVVSERIQCLKMYQGLANIPSNRLCRRILSIVKNFTNFAKK